MMKKLLSAALAVLLILSLSACGGKGKIGNTKLPTAQSGGSGTDFQKNMAGSYSIDIDKMCETESGYYLGYDAFVFYVDKKSKGAAILCNKPECSHRDDKCNAWINGYSLTAYNGKLYYNSADSVEENGGYKDMGNVLRSMELDGTKHDVVQSLEFTVNGGGMQYVQKPIIHRGIVYFVYGGILYGAPLGDDIKNAVEIFGDGTDEIGGGTINFNPNALQYKLFADGDTIYFMVNIQQSDKTYKDTLYSYQPESGKVQECWKTPDKNEVGAWEKSGVSPSAWYVKDGYLYFYLSGNDLWRADLSTGKNERLAKISEKTKYGSAIFTDSYVCILNDTPGGAFNVIGNGQKYTGGDTLFVYNIDGSFIKELSLKDLYKKNSKIEHISLLFCSGNDIYFLVDASTWNDPVNGIASPNTNLILCCADIESGELTQVYGWN